jgi:hypothetical protein
MSGLAERIGGELRKGGISVMVVEETDEVSRLMRKCLSASGQTDAYAVTVNI